MANKAKAIPTINTKAKNCIIFSKFYATLDQYDPKAFIKDNLSFECSVKTLLDILR